MSEYIDILSRWKEELSSESSEEIDRALVEIIVTIKDVDLKGVGKIAYEILINRDICHFLCELISINHLHKTPLINTIVCYLSECSSFFKKDFYRILKVYLRLLNSLTDMDELNSRNFQYIDGIFRCLSIITMRAHHQEVNLFDDLSSLHQLLSALSKLNGDLFCLQSTLQLFHQITEALFSIVLLESKSDRQCYLQFFIIIARNWKLLETNMKNVDHYSTATDVICNLIEYIVHPNETLHEEKVLTSIITDKILILSKFALEEKGPSSEVHQAIFSNFFFSLLTKTDDLLTSKVKMLNLFFKLKGYELLRNQVINDGADTVKCRKIQLFLVELMIHFTKIMRNLADERKVANIRRGFYKIMLNQTSNDHHHADLIKILNTYVDLIFNSIEKNEEFLTKFSDIIIKFNAEKFALDDNYRVMLITLFTEFFEKSSSSTSQKRRIVAKASAVLKKNYLYSGVAPEITESFIKWWVFVNSSKGKEYEKLILSYISREVFEVQNTAIYDMKWLGQLYLDESTTKMARINILQILSQSYLMTRLIEIKNYLARLQISLDNEVSFEVCGILKILSFNSSEFNLQVCKTVAPYIYQIFETKIKSIEMRYNTLQLSEPLLLRVFTHLKRTIKSLSFNYDQ